MIYTVAPKNPAEKENETRNYKIKKGKGPKPNYFYNYNQKEYIMYHIFFFSRYFIS